MSVLERFWNATKGKMWIPSVDLYEKKTSWEDQTNVKRHRRWSEQWAKKKHIKYKYEAQNGIQLNA